ncbi:MAG: hypothetical protein OM95_16765 [Bdellovibrio sp. ArHS]|uniref:hypothetical protein n=1 Tax=Bdellovibrio sp. ArHS TaxID=1569284 RepID=UPI000583D1B8|nr:hypothetical protein [Bdellovibrio sp. ArHS]KHD87003.1 MAG: hypothetical protein OM95_16765 [Bdellovibrio sp. ArHS]
MKTMIPALILMLGMNVHAGGSDIGSGTEPVKPTSTKLFMLKKIFSIEAADLKSLEKETGRRAEAYKSLGFFSVSSKSKLSRENCGSIEAHIFSKSILISALAEGEDPTAKEVQVEDQLAANLTESTKSYVKALNGAQDSCSNIDKSLDYLRSARQHAEYISSLLRKIDNGVLDAAE